MKCMSVVRLVILFLILKFCNELLNQLIDLLTGMQYVFSRGCSSFKGT